MKKINHFVNAYRSNWERRARYCFLRHCCGFNRNLTRAIVGRSDSKIVQSIENIALIV